MRNILEQHKKSTMRMAANGVRDRLQDKAKGINWVEKINKANEPYVKPILGAIEPFSAILIENLMKLSDYRSKQKLLQEVINDERFKIIDLGINTDAKTTLFPGSKISSNRKNTLEIAKDLNNRNISVHFLPETNAEGIKSADAIVDYKGRLIIADLKYSNTLKSGTLKNDLIDGFGKSQMVVLKLRYADAGILSQTIDELARKNKITGDLILVNRLGKEEFFTKKKLNNGKYINKLRGFL